jgi:acetyltransferase-like isoleucine patch superfamily enzyme
VTRRNAVKPLAAHDLLRRAAGRIYARLAALELPEVGAGATIAPRVRFLGTRNVRIGSRTNVHAERVETEGEGAIEIGDRVWIGAGCVLYSAATVTIGADTLIAGNCLLSTQEHAFDGEGPIRGQGSSRCEPVTIGAGCWLASNVVVSPGVTIGDGAVVGANSVVRSDIPAHHLAAGAPARVIRPCGEREPVTAVPYVLA